MKLTGRGAQYRQNVTRIAPLHAVVRRGFPATVLSRYVSVAIRRQDYDTPVMSTRPDLYARHCFPKDAIRRVSLCLTLQLFQADRSLSFVS
jgi:hypothetical protein